MAEVALVTTLVLSLFFLFMRCWHGLPTCRKDYAKPSSESQSGNWLLRGHKLHIVQMFAFNKLHATILVFLRSWYSSRFEFRLLFRLWLL